MTVRIAIVGGGIGGAAAALFLRRAGMDVTVYEQAAELVEIGAGIVVAPNMVRLMRELGVAHELAACAVRLEAAWEFRRWQDGRVLFVQPMGDECERLYGAHCHVVHRADLLALLHRALPRRLVRLDHRCVAVEQTEHEARLMFTSRGGATAPNRRRATLGSRVASRCTKMHGYTATMWKPTWRSSCRWKGHLRAPPGHSVYPPEHLRERGRQPCRVVDRGAVGFPTLEAPHLAVEREVESS